MPWPLSVGAVAEDAMLVTVGAEMVVLDAEMAMAMAGTETVVAVKETPTLQALGAWMGNEVQAVAASMARAVREPEAAASGMCFLMIAAAHGH